MGDCDARGRVYAVTCYSTLIAALTVLAVLQRPLIEWGITKRGVCTGKQGLVWDVSGCLLHLSVRQSVCGSAWLNIKAWFG